MWHILAVDDEPFNLDIIAEHLDDPHYKLELFPSADSAWEKLNESGTDPNVVSENAPHLIILDRMMPGMDGIELLRKLKAEPRFKHIPVILQTAASAPEQIREGIKAGAYYYLTKPYEPETLKAIVCSALSDIQKEMENEQFSLALAQSQLMQTRGEYCFKTIEEAKYLATALATLCPLPETAETGLSELLINSVEHGNLGIGYNETLRLRQANEWNDEIAYRLLQPEYASRTATVSFERLPDKIVFTITDQGNGFDWKNYLEFDPDRAFHPSGRGIAYSRKSSFSSVEYQGRGNVVIATVAI